MNNLSVRANNLKMIIQNQGSGKAAWHLGSVVHMPA
jgi:hypothetical protein